MALKPILVVTYGCFSRSYAITHKNHYERIYQPLLHAGLRFERAYVNNVVSQIDGVETVPKKEDYPQAIHEVTLHQEEIDTVLHKEIDSTDNLYTSPYYKAPNRKLFALRNSYLEKTVAELLSTLTEDYDCAIVVNSDLWIDRCFEPSWLSNLKVVVSDQNPGAGYTNGIYIGSSSLISMLLNTYPVIQKIQPLDYEFSLKWQSQNRNIPILAERIRFLKIRATAKPAYQDIEELWARCAHVAPDFYWKAPVSLATKSRFFLVDFPKSVIIRFIADFKELIKNVIKNIIQRRK